MDEVLTPFVINCFYFCDPDGRTEYVQTKIPLPIDERTPYVNRLVFEDITCYNCHIAAAYFYGLPERKIEEIIMKNIFIFYAENAKSGVPAMLCDIQDFFKHGIFATNVSKLVLNNVKQLGQNGKKFDFYNVDNIIIKEE